MSDEDSADEMEQDCKLLNGDVSYRGRGVQRGLGLRPLGAPPCCPLNGM